MTTVELNRIPAAFAELVLLSADRYREHLDRQLSHFSVAARTAVGSLVELLSRVHDLATPDGYNLGFTANHVRDADAHDVDLLINQWCLRVRAASLTT